MEPFYPYGPQLENSGVVYAGSAWTKTHLDDRSLPIVVVA